MASKRDLVEAHAFNRRRLVSAFVSGAPGGREVEPATPARAVVVGVVLTVLLVGGAALTGFLRPTLPSGWENNTLVVGKESGARYLSYRGRLYPVVNTTSARLMVPPDEFEVVFVPDEELDELRHGPTIGIVGVPDAVPPPDRLVQTGWTSCVDQYGRTRLRLAGEPRVRPAPDDAAFLVRADGELSIITGGHRFGIPKGARNPTLAALGLAAQNPVDVPGRWLDLFPAAPDLRPLKVGEAGQPAPDSLDLPAGATLGSVLEVSTSADEARYYLVRRSGLAPLSELAVELYRVEADPHLRDPVRVDSSVLADNPVLSTPHPQEWPSSVPQVLSEEVVCAQLYSGVVGADLPTVFLALPEATLTAPTAGGAATGVVPEGTQEVVVDRGTGALVQSVSGGSNRGTVFLVDANGQAYALGDGYVHDQLGYGQVRPPAVPAAWMEFMRDGPELTYDAARRPVGVGGGGGRQ